MAVRVLLNLAWVSLLIGTAVVSVSADELTDCLWLTVGNAECIRKIDCQESGTVLRIWEDCPKDSELFTITDPTIELADTWSDCLYGYGDTTIYLKEKLDAEGSDGTKSCDFSDSLPKLFFVANDINEFPPYPAKDTLPVIEVKVSENIPPHDITTIYYSDDDDGETATLEAVLITTEYASTFALDAGPVDETNNWKSFSLKALRELDYEDRPFYKVEFNITSTDERGGENNTVHTFFVYVDDQPDMAPYWSEIRPFYELDECKAEDDLFYVKAQDRDIMIDYKIGYSFEEESEYFKIDKDTGWVSKKKEIDREELLENGTSSFTLVIMATEYKSEGVEGEEPNSNEQVSVITIIDCNDEIPTFNSRTYEIEMNEVTSAGSQDLDLTIVVKDMDEGDSGAFILETDKPDQLTISPTEGKQTQEVTLTALYKKEDSLFDYENQRNISFEIQLTATEVRNSSHTDTATVTITLLDVNDEAPVFSQSRYSKDVEEGTSLNATVLKVEADDDDVSPEFGKPSIRYSLESPCNELDVDPVSGEVTLVAVLDFEAPEGNNNLIECTVIARDENGDGSSNNDPTTIAITVVDVVDEPPQFESSDVHMEIPENSEEDTDVGTFIVIDKDEDASIIFEIIDFVCSGGTTSTNVTGWFKVTPKPKDPPNYPAKLQVGKETINREACKEVTVTIQATDRNTDEKYESEASVTENFIITILDENDEYPRVECEGDCDDISVNEINELKPNTASVVVFRVMVSDLDEQDTLSLSLSDPGGVMYLSNETVTVQGGNPKLVEVRTKEGAMIDREKQDTIDFDIIAIDSEKHSTNKKISVKINDLNDKKPVITTDLCGNGVIDIEEDDGSGRINGTFIVQIQAKDDDVESPFNKVMYMMMNDQSSSSQDMSVPFTIDTVTGNVTVLLIDDRKELDREQYSTWELRFRAYDECDGSLTCTVQQSESECIVTINVTDVNDNAPEDLTWLPDEVIEVTEFLQKDEDIGYLFSATDKDEGINSTITYSVLGTYLAGSDKDEGLFRAEDEAFIESSCRLYGNEDFEGQKLRGKYTVILEAKDGGNETTNFNITIDVIDANDEAPSFVFIGCLGETEKNVIKMEEEEYLPGENGPAKMEVRCLAPDGPPFKIQFEDADEDPVNIRSLVNIDMENSTVDDVASSDIEQTLLSYWSLEPENCESDCRLYITHKIDREEGTAYNLSLHIQNTATPTKENWARVRVVVTNVMEHDPLFCSNGNCSQVVYMYENDANVAAPFDNATDEDNIGVSYGDDEYNIVYYYIVGGDEQYFQIKNEIVPTITLKDMPKGLDREKKSHYLLKIIATNDIGGPGGDIGDSARNDTLNLTIRVGDVNDEYPSFSDDILFTSFMENNEDGYTISTIEAIDLDLNETLTYEMLDDLQWFETDIMPEAPFKLERKDNRSVDLKLNIDPTGLTRGYCNFTITVEDLYGHPDSATVKVYIINEDHQVAMYFSNEVEEVHSKKKQIEDIYSSVYEYACTIDSITSTQSSTGETISNKTTVYMHFIDEEKNEPVDDKIILDLSDNVQLMTTLVDRLIAIGIYLDSVDTFLPPTNDKNPEEKIRELQILLGVVSLVLGLLVLLLATVYWLRTNKLQRKIKVLSTNTFGSKDGGLDQMGLDIASVPGSNYLAKEHGNHNPVFSESGGLEFKNQDAESISSGDSVLVGVEDNPEFKSYLAKGTPADISKGFDNPSYGRSIDDVSAAPPGVQGGMKGNPLLNLAGSKDEPRLSSGSQRTDYDGDSLQSQDATASIDENINSNFSFS